MHLLVLALALASACAAQSTAGTPGPEHAVAQPSPATAARPAVPASTDQPGASSAEDRDSQPAGPVSATTDVEASALESRIQNTLEKDPTLSPGSVRVAVSTEAVELSGSVATSRQRLTATRIAQSYAGSKRVVTRITVGASPQEPGVPEKKNLNGNHGSQRQFGR